MIAFFPNVAYARVRFELAILRGCHSRSQMLLQNWLLVTDEPNVPCATFSLLHVSTFSNMET